MTDKQERGMAVRRAVLGDEHVSRAEAAQTPVTERYLQFSQLEKVYPTPTGPLTVVENFELSLKKGEFISLIGHSGCGKSTVLTMTAGLNAISSGAIRRPKLFMPAIDASTSGSVPMWVRSISVSVNPGQIIAV